MAKTIKIIEVKKLYAQVRRIKLNDRVARPKFEPKIILVKGKKR